MLAKEVKIKTMKKQREFIKKQLLGTSKDKDGDTSYRYVGYIYPEVRKYFENEGYDVREVKNEAVLGFTKGLPLFVFTVGDIVLTEEESRQAESEEVAGEDEEEREFADFLSHLLR